MPIDFDQIDDFVDSAANAIAKYHIQFTLSPNQISKFPSPENDLHWESIPYGDEHIENVPSDRRGIYAFAICSEVASLPPHCYVLYIGIAGRKSQRSLRERYRDYLNMKKVAKRARIARMISSWRAVLRFYYAPVSPETTSDQLEEIEKQLNGALLPPMAEGDVEATIKAQRRAFR
ncbi:hypothetical protein AB6B38_07560 [Glycocaulis abyssi]|uniref:GIY-YIG domain-containing protein n=1 Tax=Glycocaulis abyssi TaxID=1433403 RepID=A0ABV9NAS6_9PROT